MYMIKLSIPMDLNESSLRHAASVIGPDVAVGELELIIPEKAQAVAAELRSIFGIPYLLVPTDLAGNFLFSVSARGARVVSEMDD